MKIGLIGWYGHGNAGDERILYCLKRFFDGHEFLVANGFADALKCIDQLNSCDYVLLGGGGLVLRGVNRYTELIEQIKPRFGCVGLGVEAYHEDNAGFIEAIKQKSDFILVRDEESRELLDNHFKVIVGPDLTFLYPFDVVEPSESDSCGVNLRDWYFWKCEHGGQYYKHMTSMVKNNPEIEKDYPHAKWEPAKAFDIIKGRFSNLAPAPLCFEDNSKSDHVLLGKFFNKVDETLSLPDIYRSCRYFVGMRIHSLIFASQTGIPFVSLSYQPKNVRFCKALGLEKLSVDLFNIDGLDNAITIMKDCYPQLRERLLNYREKAHAEIHSTMINIRKLIIGSSAGCDVDLENQAIVSSKKSQSFSSPPSMLERAIQWVKNNSIPGQGIVLTSERGVCYPEVTGYYIPTLILIGENELARQYARWLISVQRRDGSFGLDDNRYAFDTGQVVRGWAALLEEMPELEAGLRRACNWLIETADAQTGRLLVPPPGLDWKLGLRGEVSEGINLYVLKPLRQAGELLNEPGYTQFVVKSLNYYLENVILTDFSAANALTHFYAYIQEALVELGCVDAARAGMASAGRYQDSDGAVPAYSDVTWVCSTGQAQLAQVWYRLGENERADSAMRFLEVLQNPSGGFLGSYGRKADYFPDEEISWAVKYAIEAAQLQIASHFDQTVDIYQQEIAESDPRVQGVLNYLGDLNGKRVLDAGCGKGRYAAVIKKCYPQADVTALDISEEMLRHVPDGINKVQGGILDMPFADGQFDAVICIEALEHVVSIEKGIKELSRVLVGGGKVMIIDKNKEKLGQLKMPSWEKWFGSQELLDMMLSSGLEAQAQFIGYEKVTQPDGLFIAWTGQKEHAKSTRDICNDLKINDILAGINAR